jgi:sugar phosphate isomerase/epimerase
MLFSSMLFAQQEIGLQLYTFREQIPKDVPGMLKKIADMSIREVEGGGTYGMNRQEYKDLLEKNGLKMVSMGASFDELEKNPAAVAEKAKFFGAKYVMCAWVPHKGDVFTFEDAQKTVRVFNSAGKVLKEQGLSFVYHAHGYEFQSFQGGTFFDYLVKEMDPRYANFQMDVFWFYHSGQDPVRWLQRYPKRFKSLHLKDRQHGTQGNTTGHADVETNVTIGTGDVPIARIMAAAKKAGIKHYFIEDESSRSETQVPLSIAYLKSLK